MHVFFADLLRLLSVKFFVKANLKWLISLIRM